jgi:hypothetical protein
LLLRSLKVQDIGGIECVLHVETKLKQAAAGGDVTELWAALQMVLMMEKVEYRITDGQAR